MQISFGVTLNESMADAVKITVIATGFQPENAPVAQRKASEVAELPRVPEPEVFAQPAPEPEPAPVSVAPEPVAFDPDDLETPAFLRQGRLIN